MTVLIAHASFLTVKKKHGNSCGVNKETKEHTLLNLLPSDRVPIPMSSGRVSSVCLHILVIYGVDRLITDFILHFLSFADHGWTAHSSGGLW
jgi:hypothetical protein